MTSLLSGWLDQAQSASDRPALHFKGQAISRGEFWHRVARRCQAFRQAGVSKGDRVAIVLRKGPVAVECAVAAMLSGAIAVPVDVTTTRERIAAILRDVEPRVVIEDETLPETAATMPRLPVPEGADDAMILMTSGTTGAPKGIVLSHGNLSAFSDWAVQTFSLSANDHFLNIAPLHFDLAVLDVLTALRLGARVTIAEETATLFPAHLAALLEASQASVLYTVPTLLCALETKGGLETRDLAALRWVLFAGEPFPPAALGRLMKVLPQAKMANLFGPTETNVISCKILDTPPPPDDLPNIGRPCLHSKITIRDEQGEECPRGETGEICVSGPTVMRGYWRRPELTAARFRNSGELRTGDFGFVGEDNDLRFTGRRDRQVKLRGYRIELQAVELAAAQIEGVAAAAATVSADRQSLCLHVVMENPQLTDTDLLKKMALCLPRREVPDLIKRYVMLPTGSTGKIDYRALAEIHNDTIAEHLGA